MYIIRYLLLTFILLSFNYSNSQTIVFDSIARIVINKKGGVIKNNGKIFIKPKYKFISISPCDSIIWVELNEKEGYINKKGEVIIPIKYDYLSSFYNNFASAQLNNKIGFINKLGETIIPFEYDWFDIIAINSKFVEGLILIKNSDF